jgi:hypothetical protein
VLIGFTNNFIFISILEKCLDSGKFFMWITMGRQLAQDWPNLKKYQNENTTRCKQLLAKSSFNG